MTADGSPDGEARPWAALFDRASECDVTLDAVREGVAARRND